jgi:hypothetical protein
MTCLILGSAPSVGQETISAEYRAQVIKQSELVKKVGERTFVAYMSKAAPSLKLQIYMKTCSYLGISTALDARAKEKIGTMNVFAEVDQLSKEEQALMKGFEVVMANEIANSLMLGYMAGYTEALKLLTDSAEFKRSCDKAVGLASDLLSK